MRAYLLTALYRAPRPTKTAMIVYKIGVNINQIAKKINETGQIHAKDIKELQEMMEIPFVHKNGMPFGIPFLLAVGHKESSHFVGPSL